MEKTCFVCNKNLDNISLKTSRSRFKMMGLQPPMGMGESDRVCAICLNKIHDEKMKRVKFAEIKGTEFKNNV